MTPYRRLRGRGRRGGRFFAIAAPLSTAWVGPDHLLAVDMFGASEDYRRFYFREIQALAARRARAASVPAEAPAPAGEAAPEPVTEVP